MGGGSTMEMMAAARRRWYCSSEVCSAGCSTKVSDSSTMRSNSFSRSDADAYSGKADTWRDAAETLDRSSFKHAICIEYS